MLVMQETVLFGGLKMSEESVYNSNQHYFPKGSLVCVKCGASASAARGQPCVRFQASVVVA